MTDTFQGRTLCEPIVYYAWILPWNITDNELDGRFWAPWLRQPQFHKDKRHGWVLEFMVVDQYMYAKPDGLPDRTHGLVSVRHRQRSHMAVGIQCIEAPAHLVPAQLRSTPNLWHVNNHISLETLLVYLLKR